MKDIDITFHSAIRADRAAGMSYPNISKKHGGISYQAIKRILEEGANENADDIQRVVTAVEKYNTWVRDYKNPMA